MNRIQTNILSIVAASILGSVAGCSNTQPTDDGLGYQDPFFKPEYSGTSRNVARQQAASAARADATLHAAHFHGGTLNSLGEQKISLMLEDDDTTRPLTIYINVTDETAASGRRESVEAFLIANGLATDQFKLENGLNPNGVGTPVAPLLKNLSKTDSVGADAGGGMSQ